MRQAKLVKVEFADPSMAVVVCLSVSCCASLCRAVPCGVRANAESECPRGTRIAFSFLSRLEGC